MKSSCLKLFLLGTVLANSCEDRDLRYHITTFILYKGFVSCYDQKCDTIWVCPERLKGEEKIVLGIDLEIKWNKGLFTSTIEPGYDGVRDSVTYLNIYLIQGRDSFLINDKVIFYLRNDISVIGCNRKYIYQTFSYPEFYGIFDSLYNIEGKKAIENYVNYLNNYTADSPVQNVYMTEVPIFFEVRDIEKTIKSDKLPWSIRVEMGFKSGKKIMKQCP